MLLSEIKLRKYIRRMILENESEEEDDKKLTIYVLVGPPGVGKSTWINNKFKSDNEYYKIDFDDITIKVAEKYGFTYDERRTTNFF